MKITRHLAIAAAVLSATVVSAQEALTPASPSLTMHFSIEDNTGIVSGTLTAPSTDNGWEALPAGTELRLTVIRSCYSLGESDITVFDQSGIAPGTTVDFIDNVTPAWQYGNNYTYNTYAYIGENRSSWPGYGSMTPGINFMFPSKGVTLSPALDGKSVTITATVPTTDTYNNPLPVPVKSIEFYRTDRSTWPYTLELLGTDSNLTGATATFVDNNPTPDATNYYTVRAITGFGDAETTESCYVGLDVPAAPYTINAEPWQGGVRIEWTASDRGVNFGAIDPEKTVYNVYRCWGRNENERELIAERIKETEYVDYGTDMAFPRLVRYEVEAANDLGVGGSDYSSYNYTLAIGPAYTLPFVETFDGGANNVWTFENTNYYCKWLEATRGEYGPESITVEPYQGTGLIYVDYGYYKPESGSNNTMTSYKIDLSKAVNPAISYHYYAIPGSDTSIELLVSRDGENFESLSKTLVSKDASTPEWRVVTNSIAAYAGTPTLYVRLYTTFIDAPTSPIIDHIVLADYLPVGVIDAVADTDSRTITLTWADPAAEATTCTGYVGYVDNEPVGNVESPWVFADAEYGKTYSFRIEALYEGVKAPLSTAVSATVAAPAVTEFTENDYVFAVNTEAEGEAWIKEYIGTRGGIVTLPERVNYLNVTYNITKVLEGAFRNNTNIWSLSIPEGYTELCDESFAGSSALLAVSIGKDVATIGSRAFAGCAQLANVAFMSQTVPAVADDAFEGIAADCKGTCPTGTVAAYATTEALRGIDFGYNGITDIDLDNAEGIEYFDLSGRPCVPAPGTLCIARVNGKSYLIRK